MTERTAAESNVSVPPAAQGRHGFTAACDQDGWQADQTSRQHAFGEREVALFVVDGRSDREIAERLSLSHHMVSQYVKRV